MGRNVIKNYFGRYIKTVLRGTFVKSCYGRDIKIIMEGTVVKKCKISSKSVVSSPFSILSRAHSSHYTHLSHSHTFLSLHTLVTTSTTRETVTMQPTVTQPPYHKIVVAQPPSHRTTSITPIAWPRPCHTALKIFSSRDTTTFALSPSRTAPKTRQLRALALRDTAPTAISKPSHNLHAQLPPIRVPPSASHWTPSPRQLFIFFLLSIIYWINDGFWKSRKYSFITMVLEPSL